MMRTTGNYGAAGGRGGVAGLFLPNRHSHTAERPNVERRVGT